MIELRSATNEDFDFLYKLKKETMKEYVEQVWGWEDTAQFKYFKENFQPERIQIMIKENQKIGMIETVEENEQIIINNLQILPSFQNQGIGTYLFKQVIERAKIEKKTIKFQVIKINLRAFNLYKKLGFTLEGETDTHYQLVRELFE